jgi:hypothetical protein
MLDSEGGRGERAILKEGEEEGFNNKTTGIMLYFARIFLFECNKHYVPAGASSLMRQKPEPQ